MFASHASAAAHERHRSRFFVAMSVVLLLIVLTGFSRSFYLRAFFDVPPIPVHVYAHGAILTGWFVWFFLQTSLVAAGRSDLHRKLGVAGAFIGLAVILANVMVLAGMGPRLRVSFQEVDPEFLIRAVWGDVGNTVEFAVFLSTALWFRRRPELHKRLMYLASLSIVGQALGRIALWPVFDDVRKGIGIGALVFFLGALVAYDLVTAKRLSPATLYGGMLRVLGWIGVTALAASEAGEAVVRRMAA